MRTSRRTFLLGALAVAAAVHAEVLGIERDGDRYDVSTRLTGEFPGSPVEMPRRTTLRLVGGTRSPLDLRNRCTCLFPTGHPSCRSRAAIRRYP